ncbi:MAG: hypothetical protein PHC61_12245 [Chitinivibrionales bacterium]|nr:hypothetical protein [Chitinivibrionales bacterium]
MKLVRALAIALACTGLVMAQAAAPAAAPAKKEGAKMVMGTVVSVDAVANTIIVKTKKGEDTLSVDAAAKIMSGKKAITLGDLKADAKVVVSCKMVEGKKVATKITESAAKAEKVSKKTTEATTSTSTTTTTTEPAAAPAAPAPAAK